ncbi:hypothetical protein [Dyella telluris]|uniref:Uncharacterized protein n=1 Tax=Dyella telluris TaxID=2763498 RepID=A0A7G8Q2Y7_9GAMM|nr:hypothetical protein [Dyella telluris]QNK01145.1 hypothetical protein H8F01_19115 [Dyella telluris]
MDIGHDGERPESKMRRVGTLERPTRENLPHRHPGEGRDPVPFHTKAKALDSSFRWNDDAARSPQRAKGEGADDGPAAPRFTLRN